MTSNQSKSLTIMAETKLQELETGQLRRHLVPTLIQDDGVMMQREGEGYLAFCSNDYLGLARDSRLADAARHAIAQQGCGAGASRLVSGDGPLNGQLEAHIAAYKNQPAARVFGSGYLANIGVIPALVGRGDLIIMDALSHSCMHAGARLSGAEIRFFAHNDVADAEAKLADRDAFRRALILTETIFSMDGDAAPMLELGQLADATDSWLMSDDAHGLGIADLDNPAVVQMGTLSKSAGSYGGYVCGPLAFIDLLTSRARSLVYTTGLPPAVLAASLVAMDIIAQEPWRGDKARGLACRFAAALNLPEPAAAIVPLQVGAEDKALALAAYLRESGFLVPAIRPPTVPQGTARLRFTFSAAHEAAQVDALVAAITAYGDGI